MNRALTPQIEELLASQPPVFQRLGKAFHLRIRDAPDLAQILRLDEAHWLATSAPLATINCDPVFLRLLDSDADGRVRVDEVRAAVSWLLLHLSDYTGIRPANFALEPRAVRREAPQGNSIQVTISKIVARHGEAPNITLDLVRDLISSEEQGSLGHAGLVLLEAAGSADIEAFIRDLMDSYGGELHPSGELGLAEEVLNRFDSEGEKFLDWYEQGRLDGGNSAIMPLGADTPVLFADYHRLRHKLDQFFALCQVLRWDASTGLRREAAAIPDLRAADQIDDYLADAPLSAPNVDGRLDFEGPLNFYYTDELQHLRDGCLQAVLGSPLTALVEADWRRVKTVFAAHARWRDARPDVPAAQIPIERLRTYVREPGFVAELRKLIEASHRKAFVLDNLRLVEKLILYQAYLLPFVNSFVSFPDLYDRQSRAMFEMGTLIMDGRHFTLSIRVPDRALHEKQCADSNIFVLYVEVSASGADESYLVAVPVTSGGRGMLHVNKWGIFQDANGGEHHARVVHIVQNPIGMTEAAMAPFRRLGSAIANKLEDITNKAQERFTSSGQEKVGQIGTALEKPAPKPGTAAASSGGMLAGGGIAIAALGSSVAFITKTLAALSWQTVLASVLFILAMVLVPTALSAWLKLHRRDLSSILEGSGWSINERMRLTAQQASTFTYRPAYGAGLRGMRLFLRRWAWLIFVLLLLVALQWLLRAGWFDPGQLFTSVQ